MTYDQLAVRAILRNDQKELNRLGRASRIALGHLCPNCGAGHDAIEDNGQSYPIGYLCTACEYQWDSDQV